MELDPLMKTAISCLVDVFVPVQSAYCSAKALLSKSPMNPILWLAFAIAGLLGVHYWMGIV